MDANQVKNLNFSFKPPVINGNPLSGADAKWIGVSILLFVFFYYEFLSSPSVTNPGNIYLVLYTFAIFIYGGALASRNKGVLNMFHYGYLKDMKDLYKSILIGAIFGTILVVGYANSNNLLSIFSPPILAISGTALLGLYLTQAIVQIYGAETEEFAIQDAIIPTILRLLKSGSELPIIFTFFGLFFLVTPVVQNILIGLGLLAAAVIFVINPNLGTKFSNQKMLRFFASFTVGAFIFALFHIYAYGQAPNAIVLFESAFAFSIIDSIINYIMGNTIGGRIGHSMNNGFIFAIANNISFQIPILIELIYIMIIVIVYRYRNSGFDIRR